MEIHRSLRGMRPFVALIILAAACTGGGGGSVTAGHGTDGTTTSEDPPTDSAMPDSTGTPLDPTCIDDYHGNQDPQTALDLGLDPLETAFVVLGDGFVADPPELGGDQLSVCDATPSDFFALEIECPGFLSAEARTLGGGVPELLLYDTIQPNGQPVEQVMGSWTGFFLKPLQGEVDPGSYVIEVRHSGGGPQPYSLAVALLPESPCPPP